MSALLLTELRRALRNRRTMVFAAALPAVFFLTFSAGSKASSRLGGLGVAAYVMVSMATYGAMNALFTGGGVIAGERAIGWNRQLRIAGLSGRDYVATKVCVSYLTALPGVVVVLVLGASAKGVHLPVRMWLLAPVSVLLGLLPVAALGIAVGYLARPQTLQALFGVGSALLSLLGGLWVPAENFPRGIRDVMKVLPTYWSADAGRAVLRGSWLGWTGAGVLLAWTVLLGGVAVRAYRRDSLRPASAGTT